MTRKSSKVHKLITPSIYHRTIDGVELIRRREALGLSQATFANLCGHSQQFQQRLEAPGGHEILATKADEIADLLGD